MEGDLSLSSMMGIIVLGNEFWLLFLLSLFLFFSGRFSRREILLLERSVFFLEKPFK